MSDRRVETEYCRTCGKHQVYPCQSPADVKRCVSANTFRSNDTLCTCAVHCTRSAYHERACCDEPLCDCWCHAPKEAA